MTGPGPAGPFDGVAAGAQPQPGTAELGIERLLVVVTGSAYAWSTPYWLDLLRLHHPRLDVKVVLTRSAERFVTRQSVASRVGGAVYQDDWPADAAGARHVEWAEWADAIVVYPATLHFMARLALGLSDSPALLAAHCSGAPVAVAPALPPGGLESPVVRQHWAALAARPDVILAPPVPGRSLTTGRDDAWVPPPLPDVLHLLAERIGTGAGAESRSAAGTESPFGAVAEKDEDHPVREFGTGLLHTAVHARPLPSGGRLWRRTPGPLAPAPFEQHTRELARLLEEAPGRTAPVEAGRPAGSSGPSGRLVVGAVDGGSRLYDVCGETSLAHLVLNEGPRPAFAGPLRELGRLLRALHDTRPPGPLPYRPSRGLRRLDDWLAGRAAVPRAACALGEVRRSLGEERWSLLRGWRDGIATDPTAVLCHGAAGLGSLVVNPDEGTQDLLVGEDLYAGPWYADVGWVVGELVELQWQVGGDKEDWQRLTDAFLEGYGRDLGPEWNRIAALRILLHVHDIAAYLEGFEHGFDHYSGFLRFLVDL
ncbi:flavoprotein [Streptomyces sp. NPDC005805]|uniref:flavoprotein n=1 Tax=Streptomyces sp. NPDC005805 TaxID=3157068 RepID=UPI0033D7A00D